MSVYTKRERLLVKMIFYEYSIVHTWFKAIIGILFLSQTSGELHKLSTCQQCPGAKTPVCGERSTKKSTITTITKNKYYIFYFYYSHNTMHKLIVPPLLYNDTVKLTIA